MSPKEQKGAVELGLQSSIVDCQKKATENGCNNHILGNCPVPYEENRLSIFQIIYITHSSLLFKRIMKKPATTIKSVYGNSIRTSRKDKSIWLSARDLHTVRTWANSHPDLWNTNHRRATLALISFCLCLFVEGISLTFGSSNPLVSLSQHFTTVLTGYNQLSLTTYRLSCWRVAVCFCFWFAADASNFWTGVGWEKKSIDSSDLRATLVEGEWLAINLTLYRQKLTEHTGLLNLQKFKLIS